MPRRADPPRIRWNCRRSFGMNWANHRGTRAWRVGRRPHLRCIAVALAICASARAGLRPAMADGDRAGRRRRRIDGNADSGHAAHVARLRAAAQYHGRAAHGPGSQARSRCRRRRRPALARGPADPGRAEHRSGPRVARFPRPARARRQAAARLHPPRGEPADPARAWRVRGQRRLRARQSHPQDHGLERACRAGALRAQRRRACA